MFNDLLRQQHAKIGLSIEAAEKANPFVAMTIAKKAAADSHELIGLLIEEVEKLMAANDARY
ncbi:hypothetical protein [Shewanella subflava]|uniref:Uncharacterized protein n=1 Tax=Shewanella subflava TaxID=2986476 RepID=A0ABT3ICH6_9GAMM|nr:hypothetical protein [Shewanella subflava]MCW3173758.1 hypothetical protein [Shewanella subflava]